MELFRQRETQVIFTKFIRRLDEIEPPNEFEKKRNEQISAILSSMKTAAEDWDQKTPSNSEWIGSNLLSRVSENTQEVSSESLDWLYANLYRFLMELYLRSRGDLVFELATALQFAEEHFSDFSFEAQRIINWARQGLPLGMYKQLMTEKGLEALQDFTKFSTRLEEKQQSLENDFAEREAKVSALNEKLETYAIAYNFVGLYQGFDNLAKQKVSERRVALAGLWLTGCAALAPVIAQAAVIVLNIDRSEWLRDWLMLTTLPAISAIVLMIYYFRVFLTTHTSIRSQLLQIDLRKSLCAFIQNYAEYAQDINQKNAGILEKFENVVFSNVVATDDKIPSTYDGLEYLANIIGKLKPS